MEFQKNKNYKENTFTLFSDSEYARDNDRKTRYGFIVKSGLNTILYKSKKLKLIAMSTTEAELLGFIIGLKEMIHILQVFKFLNIKIVKKQAYCDNLPAVKILLDLNSVGRTKHLDIRILFSRQYLDLYSISLDHISTNINLADGFTKILSPKKFNDRKQNFVKTLK